MAPRIETARLLLTWPSPDQIDGLTLCLARIGGAEGGDSLFVAVDGGDGQRPLLVGDWPAGGRGRERARRAIDAISVFTGLPIADEEC